MTFPAIQAVSVTGGDTLRIVRRMDWWRIAKARAKDLGITQEEIADHLGVERAAVSHYLTGKREPSIEGLRKLAGKLGLTMNQLLGDAGESLDISASVIEPNRDAMIYVPRVEGAHLSAGSGEIIYDFETIEGSRAFEKQWMQDEGLDPRRCRIWQVRGDSMYPEIPEGSAVMVNSAQRDPVHDEIFAIITDDGLRLKRLALRDDGVWEIRSDNPDKRRYPTETLTPGKVAILGMVRWSARTHGRRKR